MKTKNKKMILGNIFNGKRDYYFHADEDFREDREWGKLKPTEVIKSNLSSRKVMPSANSDTLPA